MNIFTIGFTKKPARKFFGLLMESKATRLVDVRLNNVSQLSGFAKRDDLAFFAKELCAMEYSHDTLLAPTQRMLQDYKKYDLPWASYESQFLNLLEERHVASALSREKVDNCVLLCSEDKPHRCHRRLVAEYLLEYWTDVTITHLT